MNRNLVGSTYWRFSIKLPQSRMKGERHRLSPPILYIWKLLSQESLFIDKCENDIHAHAYYQFDTYVAEFHIVSWRQMMPRGKP
jgi:hypothetical protein